MKDKFITSEFEIDLSECKISVTEENPRFKDSFWTKYSLPFDVNMDRNLQSKLGHYSSHLAKGLKRYHEGTHVFEGKLMKGKLEILEIKGNSLKCQIDSGFEDLPNFDTSLSELPLMQIDVADIYLHAEEICKKKYPETVYNFPKLITDQFDLDSEEWKYFDGIINNRYQKSWSWIFPRNEVVNDTDVANRNIIHPLPYLLYVLEIGFKDAGFILSGDVLNDETLRQRTVYSGGEYFTTGDQKNYKENVYDLDYTAFTVGYQTTYFKKIKITAPGRYRFLGRFLMETGDKLSIYRNDFEQTIFQTNDPDSYVLEFSEALGNTIVFDVSIAEALEGVTIGFKFDGKAKNNEFDAEGNNIGVAQIKVNPIRAHSESGDAIPFVFNENRVDLKRAVPDMTFGELVTTIKNWRNYDLIFDGSRVYMNYIKIAPGEDPVDFRNFEIEKPLRKFTDKQSFIIKFPDTDVAQFDSIYFDENGYKLNGIQNKNTSEITINGFAVPLATFRGTTTSKITDDANVLQLVYYDGLNAAGYNHATNPKGLHGDEIARFLQPWFTNRVTNIGFQWTKIVSKNQIKNIDIRTEIFCYGKRQWFKTITKNQITANVYSIEFVTEGLD